MLQAAMIQTVHYRRLSIRSSTPTNIIIVSNLKVLLHWVIVSLQTKQKTCNNYNQQLNFIK